MKKENNNVAEMLHNIEWLIKSKELATAADKREIEKLEVYRNVRQLPT